MNCNFRSSHDWVVQKSETGSHFNWPKFETCCRPYIIIDFVVIFDRLMRGNLCYEHCKLISRLSRRLDKLQKEQMESIACSDHLQHRKGSKAYSDHCKRAKRLTRRLKKLQDEIMESLDCSDQMSNDDGQATTVVIDTGEPVTLRLSASVHRRF
jgi:hypothetical protein